MTRSAGVAELQLPARRASARLSRDPGGVTRLSPLRFFMLNAAGGIVWASVVGLAGYLLGEGVHRIAAPIGSSRLSVGALWQASFSGASSKAMKSSSSLKRRRQYPQGSQQRS